MSFIEAFAGFGICLFHCVLSESSKICYFSQYSFYTVLLLTMVSMQPRLLQTNSSFPLRFGQICQNLIASLPSSIETRAFVSDNVRVI